jgi:hypothetical protein
MSIVEIKFKTSGQFSAEEIQMVTEHLVRLKDM